ncbi:hypothetical protein CSOJ01_06809 [Colletotrichum sojae]|uniref:Uncharacterized protein n=1 Tax=Colletotrichum sojae TaxID=2175907 RepID=A0A8H6JAS6_9PEZI|nr:hypothetical protein CSOJ01_06809 [Colletotrichum sojae]
MVSRYRACLSHVLLCLVSFWAVPAWADYFTEPPSFERDRGGNKVTVPDLNTTYVLGQKVQITWEVPSVPWISLVLVYWGKDAGVSVKSFITNSRNTGYYTWYIGEDDGLDEAKLASNPNFALQFIDPTRNYTKTGEPAGFIDNVLQSRGFVIKANATEEPAEPEEISGGSSSLSAGVVAGIAVGSAAAGALAMLAVWFFFIRKRSSRPGGDDPPRHHPTPTLEAAMRQQPTRQDLAWASPSSSNHMFEAPNPHGSYLSHQVSNVSPISQARPQTPPLSYPSQFNEHHAPVTELSSVRDPQEVHSTSVNHPAEIGSSHRH